MEFRDEVILGLECCIKSDETGLCPVECPIRYKYGHECETGLKKDARELLKEQEPVKPIEERLNEVDSIYRCGNCKTHFYYRQQKYCAICGRRAKWDG